MTPPNEKKRAPYRIETSRLVLRPYAPTDAGTLQETTARCKEHLLPYLPWARFEPQSLDEKLDLILGFRSEFDAASNYIYGIFDRKSEELIGGTGLHPRLGAGAFELGYWITPEAQGRGYVAEAARALCRVAFDGMQLDIVGIRMEVPNTRSEGVASRLGFIREGLLRNALRSGTDEPKDALQYTLLKTEYMKLVWRQEAIETVRAFDALERAWSMD